MSTLTILLLSSYSFAQQTFKINPKESKLNISGTSSIHDWEITAKNFSGEATISFNDNSITGINNVEFSCPVEDIECDNRIMDNKTQKALNSDKYPEIQFHSNNTVNGDFSKNDSEIKGTVTINNTKKEVDINFTYEKVNSTQVKVKGEVPLKMSDFNVEPPTAMMGALKTADEIKVIYEILFEK